MLREELQPKFINKFTEGIIDVYGCNKYFDTIITSKNIDKSLYHEVTVKKVNNELVAIDNNQIIFKLNYGDKVFKFNNGSDKVLYIIQTSSVDNIKSTIINNSEKLSIVFNN
jgi:hypothetical protein